MAAAVVAQAAEIVGDVDHQGRVVFVAERPAWRAMSGVSESIENRPSVTTMMPFSVSLARMPLSQAPAVLDIEMPEDRDVPGRRIGAFLQAGVGQGVHDDVVVRRAPGP